MAVSGGAGDGSFDAARAAGADVYLTADLRHHPASESLEEGSPALVDVSHWASEWPWLGGAARLLADRLGQRSTPAGATVKTHISTIVTDPWTAHIR